LSDSEVETQYSAAGVPPNFIVAPPTTMSNYDGQVVSVPVSLVGTPPMGYQWLNTTAGTNVTTGTGNGPVLNATLNTTVPLGWNGDTLELIVTNQYGSKTVYLTLTVSPAVPQIIQDIQPQAVFIYQPVQFSAAASGSAPLTYQWTFNGNPIAGANSNTLTLNNVTTANAGNYQLLVTNHYGFATSSIAALTVETPPAGSYAAGVMGPNLLLYYPLNDAGSPSQIATNLGSLGMAYNGTYEGGYYSIAGPAGFSNFGTNTLAAQFDGASGDVNLPSVPGLALNNCTIAAWVNDTYGGQPDNDAIFFHRQTSVFGLASGNNILGASDWLKYTWDNDYYDNYTGLVFPTNQWAFVALVISPAQATVYLQNGVSLNSASFPGTYGVDSFDDGVSYIGYDTAGNGLTPRRWNGGLGQVMVFDQALSPAEINALYAGVPPAVTLSLAQSGKKIVLTWPQGTLLQATNLTGPWVTNSAASPYTNTATGAAMFYRVLVQ